VLRQVTATRYVTPLREGGSLPGVVEADDLGTYVVKFRGAGQGPKALVAEVISGELARRLELPVPDLVVTELDPVVARAEPDEEVQELIKASAGTNLGMDFLPGALGFDALAHPVDAGLASGGWSPRAARFCGPARSTWDSPRTRRPSWTGWSSCWSGRAGRSPTLSGWSATLSGAGLVSTDAGAVAVRGRLGYCPQDGGVSTSSRPTSTSSWWGRAATMPVPRREIVEERRPQPSTGPARPGPGLPAISPAAPGRSSTW
jgi:hypothetical protein